MDIQGSWTGAVMNGVPAALQNRDPACAAAQVNSRHLHHFLQIPQSLWLRDFSYVPMVCRFSPCALLRCFRHFSDAVSAILTYDFTNGFTNASRCCDSTPPDSPLVQVCLCRKEILLQASLKTAPASSLPADWAPYVIQSRSWWWLRGKNKMAGSLKNSFEIDLKIC